MAKLNKIHNINIKNPIKENNNFDTGNIINEIWDTLSNKNDEEKIEIAKQIIEKCRDPLDHTNDEEKTEIAKKLIQ